MRQTGLIFATGMTIAAMLGGMGLALAHLPPGATLPIHWSAGGEADNFASAPLALSIAPVMTLLTAALLMVLPSLPFTGAGLARSPGLRETVWATLLVLFGSIQFSLVGIAMDWATRGPLAVDLAVAFLFIVLGNILPKSRPMHFIGFRTPWALADEDNWIATHRLAGRIMMIEGLVMIPLAVLPVPRDIAIPLRQTMGLGMVIAVFLYSWQIARRKAR